VFFFEPHYHGSAPAFRRRGVPGATACAGPAVVSTYLRTIVHCGQGVDGFTAYRHEHYSGSWCVDMAHAGQNAQDHADNRAMTPNHHDEQ
jgi:hypothetical protein